MTNLLPIEGDSLRGFSLHHDHVPLIFVNWAVRHPAARSFTLLHELAHLLRGVDKACDKHDLQSRTSEEAWCNRFAAAFLMPKTELATRSNPCCVSLIRVRPARNDEIGGG